MCETSSENQLETDRSGIWQLRLGYTASLRKSYPSWRERCGGSGGEESFFRKWSRDSPRNESVSSRLRAELEPERMRKGEIVTLSPRVEFYFLVFACESAACEARAEIDDSIRERHVCAPRCNDIVRWLKVINLCTRVYACIRLANVLRVRMHWHWYLAHEGRKPNPNCIINCII